MSTAQNEELDELLLKAAKGDEIAFRRFYDRTAPAMLAFLLRLVRDRYHAEDILQDSMVVAWNQSHSFDPERASAKTWITTIARRRALNLLRSGARRSAILRDDAGDIRTSLGLDNLAIESATGPASPESSATNERLMFCFGELTSDAAACIRHAYLDGMTFVEISAQVERSLGTVKSWIRRGLAKLKECMQP